MVKLDIDLNLLTDEGLKCYLIIKQDLEKAKQKEIPVPPKFPVDNLQTEEQEKKKKWLA